MLIVFLDTLNSSWTRIVIGFLASYSVSCKRNCGKRQSGPDIGCAAKEGTNSALVSLLVSRTAVRSLRDPSGSWALPYTESEG
jgi:hypothetical protein